MRELDHGDSQSVLQRSSMLRYQISLMRYVYGNSSSMLKMYGNKHGTIRRCYRSSSFLYIFDPTESQCGIPI